MVLRTLLEVQDLKYRRPRTRGESLRRYSQKVGRQQRVGRLPFSKPISSDENREANSGKMKRSSRVAFFLALVNQSFAFCPAVTGDLLSFSSNPILVTGTGNSMSGGFACDVLSRCPRGSTGQSSRWHRQGSRKRSIALSGVGSIMSPPPPTLVRSSAGDLTGPKWRSNAEIPYRLSVFDLFQNRKCTLVYWALHTLILINKVSGENVRININSTQAGRPR